MLCESGCTVTCGLATVSGMYVIDIGYGVSQLMCEMRKRGGVESLWDMQEGGAHVGRMYQKCRVQQGLSELCMMRYDMSLSLCVCCV